MQRKIKQIRDLEIIEKELNDCSMGIFAFHVDEEKVIQVPTTFLYRDKNIFFFIDDSNELFNALHIDAIGSFAVIKNDKVKKSPKGSSSYQAFAVTISGIIRKVEEQKMIDDIRQNFHEKYLKQDAEKENGIFKGKLIMIDTEEIQAVEETGGAAADS